MSRRRRRSAPLSLFAFQDVMAAVIGILFFLVLLLALDLVNRGAAAASVGGDPEPLRARLGELERELLALEETLRAAARRSARTPRDANVQLREVLQLQESLQALYQAIEQRQAQLSRRARDLDPMHAELAGLETRLAELQTREEGLDQEIARARSRPRVSYILEAARSGLKPWLLELSASEYRVGAPDGGSSVTTFRGEDEARLELLLAWVATQRPDACYFVLLIKPSGAALALEVQRELIRRGFKIGTDLLPEAWEAF